MELREYDQAGREVAVYVCSEGSDRIEFIVSLVHQLPIPRATALGSSLFAYKFLENRRARHSMDAAAQRLPAGRLSS